MTANSVENHHFIPLNLKLQVEIKFKKFFDFKICYKMFSPDHHLKQATCFAQISVYPSNKSVIYRPELNL